MACDISNGRIEQCKDSVSGLKAIYIINYDKLRVYVMVLMIYIKFVLIVVIGTIQYSYCFVYVVLVEMVKVNL